MLGVDSAASMMRYSLTALDSNKPISLRLAHFAQFKEGRLRSLRILVDSYELVEQALGSPAATGDDRAPGLKDLVEIGHPAIILRQNERICARLECGRGYDFQISRKAALAAAAGRRLQYGLHRGRRRADAAGR